MGSKNGQHNTFFSKTNGGCSKRRSPEDTSLKACSCCLPRSLCLSLLLPPLALCLSRDHNISFVTTDHLWIGNYFNKLVASAVFSGCFLQLISRVTYAPFPVRASSGPCASPGGHTPQQYRHHTKENADSSPPQNLLKQNLHFNKIPGDSRHIKDEEGQLWSSREAPERPIMVGAMIRAQSCFNNSTIHLCSIIIFSKALSPTLSHCI